MTKNFHEQLTGEKVNPPTDRATGIVFAVVALIVAVLWRQTPTVLWSAVAISAALGLLSAFAPSLLRPLNLAWFKIGLLLHKVVNPLVMFIIFAGVFVPAGALMRLRRDPLRKKRASDTDSYWIDRSMEKPAKRSMTNQF